MRIYCKLCDKVQPVVIDNCRDAKTGEPYQDIVCKECHLVIASGMGIQPADEPVAEVTSETGAEITMSWWHEPALPLGTKLYTRPQPADEITKLLGEIGVLVGLLKWASQVIETVEGEDVAECEALMELQNKITYAIQGAST